MKAFVAPFAAIVMAATVLAATALTAQAFPTMADWHGPSALGAPAVATETADDLHALYPCVGLASGTAHHSCGGTATGGPVGGLF